MTLHLGGTLAEVAASEAEVAAGRHPDRPYCLVASPAWPIPAARPRAGTCCGVLPRAVRVHGRHVRADRGPDRALRARLPRPGAGPVRAHGRGPGRHDPNYVGGDINGGAGTLTQTLLRPVPRWNPYRTPARGLYLCSASTPPGGGVHGMCGYWAARTALRDLGLKA